MCRTTLGYSTALSVPTIRVFFQLFSFFFGWFFISGLFLVWFLQIRWVVVVGNKLVAFSYCVFGLSVDCASRTASCPSWSRGFVSLLTGVFDSRVQSQCSKRRPRWWVAAMIFPRRFVKALSKAKWSQAARGQAGTQGLDSKKKNLIASWSPPDQHLVSFRTLSRAYHFSEGLPWSSVLWLQLQDSVSGHDHASVTLWDDRFVFQISYVFFLNKMSFQKFLLLFLLLVLIFNDLVGLPLQQVPRACSQCVCLRLGFGSFTSILYVVMKSVLLSAFNDMHYLLKKQKKCIGNSAFFLIG